MPARTRPIPVLCTAALATALALAPYTLGFDAHFPTLQPQAALAKDGNNGGGNGNGGGGNNAGGNAGGNNGNAGGNNGNAGGNNGNAGGNNGNAGNKNGNAGGKGNTGSARGNAGVASPGPSAVPGRVAIDSPVEVRHRNGMSERIKDGRYLMKDAKGRTIIERTATVSDQTRLNSLTR
ncbi:hypothetical protein FHS20_003104 [Phyllobacterium endophyticum]|nr:hypothetical protein [Phyllobacterium endophyticum]MBB3236226.1 hypothetical protein [Phyllobacterium endophyticum]